MCKALTRHVTWESGGIPKLLALEEFSDFCLNGLDKDIKIPPPEIQGYTQTDTVGGRPCKNPGEMVLEQ